MASRDPFDILVVCDGLIVAGGLLRFVRISRELSKDGHRVFFLPLRTSDIDGRWYHTDRVVDRQQADQMQWGMTMIPGAGFPDVVIEEFGRFNAPRFGRRVQHVLNDQTRNEAFLKVNREFQPDVVVFNNRHWAPGSFTRFKAKKFVFLEGAVNTRYFVPFDGRKEQSETRTFKLGALAHKNLDVVLDALDQLPSDFRLITIGRSPDPSPRLKRYRESGRLEERGMVDDAGLLEFYRSVDAVVHAEAFAGWANMPAEAMACGVPVVCTRHGTLAFAEHESTALVVERPNGQEIADNVLRLSGDAGLRNRLAIAARQRIENYDWSDYARDLIDSCRDDGRDHYTFAPELGLHGKWPLATRLKGLRVLLNLVGGKTVLDLACAEGVVARECLARGARIVHGFELDRSRVSAACSVCGDFTGDSHAFRVADLSDWNAFARTQADLLLSSYDVVLHLGLQHHLPYPARIDVLRQAAHMASELLVMRTPEDTYQHDRIEQIMNEAGFVLKDGLPDDGLPGTGGGVRVFARRSGEPGQDV